MRSRSPKIVLLLMDNLGWGEPGVYGGGILRGLSANAVILSDADHSPSRQTNGKMDGPTFPSPLTSGRIRMQISLPKSPWAGSPSLRAFSSGESRLTNGEGFVADGEPSR
jgi:arylsulfatase